MHTYTISIYIYIEIPKHADIASHRCLLYPYGSPGPLWAGPNTFGPSNMCMNIYGPSSACMHVYGASNVCMNIYGASSVCMKM